MKNIRFCLTLLAACFTISALGDVPYRISLDGEWLFKKDPSVKSGGGAANGWEQPDTATGDWGKINVGAAWEVQGHANYNGIGWYRRDVVIPAAWQSLPVVINVGMPDDKGELYFNGKSILEVKKFGDVFRCVVPGELIKFGAKNTIAVRVSDWYMNGGLSSGTFALETVGTFVQDSATTHALPLALSLTDANTKWRDGMRDGGTLDKRPKLSKLAGAFNGKDALDFHVIEPQSAMEYMDCDLATAERGSVWKSAGYDYISFYVRSEIAGEMILNLNDGNYKWGSRGWNFGADFLVTPNTEWTRVVLPFSAFTTGTRAQRKALDALDKVRTVTIGYRNNCLRSAGHVAFAGFEVGRFALPQSETPIVLAGLWRVTFDAEDVRPGPVEIPSFKTSQWHTVSAPMPLERQGFPKFNGTAWYRAKVFVPAAWQGRALELKLGQPDDRGEIYWNGKSVCVVPKFGDAFGVTLDAKSVKYGAENDVLVRIVDQTNHGGIIGSVMSLAPVREKILLNGAPAEGFKMPATPPKSLTLGVTFAKGIVPDSGTLRLFARDHYYNTIAFGATPVRNGKAEIALDSATTHALFYGENFRDVVGWVEDARGSVLYGFADWAIGFDYSARDALKLPALPETYEETPYGKLKLVDVVDGTDTNTHPYKQGAIGDSWVGRRAYDPTIEGVRMGALDGVNYREAINNAHFGWRIGRGTLKIHSAYLLRVRIPDDKPRYFAMDIKTGRNYQGTGYRSGRGPNDPVDPYPVSGRMQWYDHLVFTDDLGYGFKGSRHAPMDFGFWVFFHDIGRCYGQGYAFGPGVAEMRLYEVPNPEKLAPVVNFPKTAPRRALMMDWEREPEAPPADVARYARFMGMTEISPTIQKWASMAFWHTEMGWRVPALGSFGDINRGRPNGDIYGGWLDGTRAFGQGFIPRVEYGGSADLPKEARAVGANGKSAAVGRYATWGADLCHEATWLEFKQLIDELVRKPIAAGNTHIKGLHWRMRNDRMVISYAQANVARFAKDTGTAIPADVAGDQVKLAAWASKGDVGKAYEDWWQRQKRAFLERIRDELKSIRPDLKFYYYNWDQDGWKLGDNIASNAVMKPLDWFEYYSLDNVHKFYARMAKNQASHKPADYVAMLDKFGKPHQRPRMDLYRDVTGIGYFVPVHWYYLANNPAYLNYFRTGDGVVANMQYYYQEKGRWNVQNDNYETSEMTPGGEEFAMAEHVLACFHADPVAFTETLYTYGIGFVNKYREFAQAYLALPATDGEVLAQRNPDVRVRLYKDGNEQRLGIVNKAFAPQKNVIITLPAGAKSIVNAATGETVHAVNGTVTIDLPTCSLSAWLVK